MEMYMYVIMHLKYLAQLAQSWLKYQLSAEAEISVTTRWFLHLFEELFILNNA